MDNKFSLLLLTTTRTFTKLLLEYLILCRRCIICCRQQTCSWRDRVILDEGYQRSDLAQATDELKEELGFLIIP